MPTFPILAVVVALLASLIPAVQAQSAEDEVAVRGLIEQIYAASNKHDATALAALLHENVEDWTGSLKGRAAWAQYQSALWGRQKNIQYKHLEEVGIQFVTPDVAIYKSRSQVSGRLDEDGKPEPPSNWDSARVCVKEGGEWLLRRCSSGDRRNDLASYPHWPAGEAVLVQWEALVGQRA